jgi:hypothetical protein
VTMIVIATMTVIATVTVTMTAITSRADLRC